MASKAVSKQSFEVAKYEARHLSPLGENWKGRIVTQIAEGVRTLYVDKQMAGKMAKFITQNFANESYRAFTHPSTFIDAVREDLTSICPDKHLRLMLCESYFPSYDPARELEWPSDEELTPQQKEYLDGMISERPAFSEYIDAYMLPESQIGYFKLDRFPDLDYPETAGLIDEAMKKVMDAEVLVIDLRENYGGIPETAAFVASYLFDNRTLINQIYQRSNDEWTSFYAEPEKLDQTFGGEKPVYVLTSEKTFSAAEELAYDLQSSKRAKVIGQTTGGGAHPQRVFVVDNHVFMNIPFKKAINPFTNANWEVVGVVPDHITEMDALDLTKLL